MIRRITGILSIILGVCASSCLMDPEGQRTISGRLTTDFGCYLLVSDHNTYELFRWEEPVPPLGAQVTLLVKPITDAASICMVGQMVDVIKVVDVQTDFRTAAVVGEETWGPDDEIVLGRVDVQPGAVLTVLPGTIIQVIREGELRIRGRILMLGVSGDSVQVTGVQSPRWGRLFSGPVVFDSVSAGSRVEYVNFQSAFHVLGDAPTMQHVRGRCDVSQGKATVRDSYLPEFSANEASVVLERCDVGWIMGGETSFKLERNRLSKVSLRNSEADARYNVFGGKAGAIAFRGSSGGTFERNTFEAESLQMLIYDDSDPRFQQNNFVSPEIDVDCRYHRGFYIDVANNWWGTIDEAAIIGRFHSGCYIHHSPWLTEPVQW